MRIAMLGVIAALSMAVVSCSTCCGCKDKGAEENAQASTQATGHGLIAYVDEDGNLVSSPEEAGVEPLSVQQAAPAADPVVRTSVLPDGRVIKSVDGPRLYTTATIGPDGQVSTSCNSAACTAATHSHGAQEGVE